jgi:hypothetical protein
VWLLAEFFKWEERSAEAALPKFLDALRSSGLYSLDLIAHMLDPNEPGPWKLELKRGAPGKPSDRSGEYSAIVGMYYLAQLQKFKTEGVRSPAKEARRTSAKVMEMSENDIRKALRSYLKRYPTHKP